MKIITLRRMARSIQLSGESGKKLRTHINENGYKRVTLRHNGKTVVRRIARLVASAFLNAWRLQKVD